MPEERRGGRLDVDASTPSSITAHAPGYIGREDELIVGLQTDAPLQARDHAQRRLADGRERRSSIRLRAGRARARDLHEVPQDP